MFKHGKPELRIQSQLRRPYHSPSYQYVGILICGNTLWYLKRSLHCEQDAELKVAQLQETPRHVVLSLPFTKRSSRCYYKMVCQLSSSHLILLQHLFWCLCYYKHNFTSLPSMSSPNDHTWGPYLHSDICLTSIFSLWLTPSTPSIWIISMAFNWSVHKLK
jgi:hypothetical protein